MSVVIGRELTREEGIVWVVRSASSGEVVATMKGTAPREKVEEWVELLGLDPEC